MLRRLDFDERHFLNLMLAFERKHSKGLADHQFLVHDTDEGRCAAPASSRMPLILVMDNLRSAFNVGAIFRTADCLGVARIVACGYTATPDDPSVRKTTLGAWEHVDWAWRKETAQAIDELRASGLPVIALETVEGAPLAHHYPFPRSGCALLLGNERHGCSPELLAKCDGVVQLPCRGVKNSMNVGVALGMCGYEIMRQWTEVDEAEAEATACEAEASMRAEAAALMARANDYAEEGEFVAAASLFREASELYAERGDGSRNELPASSEPLSEPPPWSRATAEALASLRTSEPPLDLSRATSRALESLAQCLLELGMARRAAAAAEAAVRHDVSWGAAWVTYARALLNAGSFGESAAAFQRALALDGSLADEVGDDLATAQALQIKADEVHVQMAGGMEVIIGQRRTGSDADCCAALSCSECGNGNGQDQSPPGGQQVGGRQGTGTVVWESGLALANLMLHCPAIQRAVGGAERSAAEGTAHAPQNALAGRRVLEIGSGTGVAGITAAAMGAHVMLTDVPEVLPLLRENAARNANVIAKGGGSVVVRPCTWGAVLEDDEDGAAVSAFIDRAELVLAADVAYHRDGSQLAPLCKLLKRAMAPSKQRPAGARMLLVHKSRHTALDAMLPQRLQDLAGASLQEIAFEEMLAEWRSPAIKVYSGDPIVMTCKRCGDA